MFWRKLCVLPIIILAILLYRTYVLFKPDPAIFERCSPSDDHHSLTFDRERLETFQTLLRFQTISHEENHQNLSEIKKCRDFIRTHYHGLVANHSNFVRLDELAEYSLVYSIQGKDPTLKPFLLSAHMDVVPAGNLERWTHPPFDAHSDGELIFARGTLDDK